MLLTLKNLHLTFYSAPFYRQLITSWKGVGFGFLIIAALLNLVSIIINIQFTQIETSVRELFSELPDIEMTDGTLSMSAPSPYQIDIMKKAEEGPYLIIFDMKETEEDLTTLMTRIHKEKIILFVTPTQIILNNLSQNKADIKSFHGMNDFTMTRENWTQFGENIISYLAPSMAIPLFGIMLTQHLFTTFICAGFLLLLSMILKFQTQFTNMFRLAAAAKIPVATLSLLVTPDLAMQGVIWVGFALFGLLAARNIQKPLSQNS